MAALPMIAEEIVSEVLFHFMWALLMEVVSMF
jgi:hypothetical protein